MMSIERGIARVVLAGCLFAVAAATLAAPVPDYARESRWADEVAPQLVVGDAIWLATAHRARVLAIYAAPTGASKGAVIVVHGLGVHPDWSLIGEIRSGLVDRGFATLSVQMPVLAADARREDYAALMPLAAERLDAALDWLRAHGHTHVAVLSHSLGAAMVDAWMTQQPQVDAWVPVGMLEAFTSPPRTPVLDVIAQQDYPEVVAASLRRRNALRQDGCSTFATVADTDHFMTRAVPRLLDVVSPFLERALAGRCRRAAT